MSNQINFIKSMLYNLTKEYGTTVQLRREIVGVTNYTTGSKSIEPYVINIKRVIRFPEQSSRLSNLDFIFKKFSLPTLPDVHSRQFIINAKNLPTDFKPKQEDVITVGSIGFRIAKVEELDYQLGYLISAEEVP